MYLIVPALPQAATGDAVLLRPNQCRGPQFARSPKIRYWHSATGHGKGSRQAELRNSEQSLTISRAAQTTELKLLQGELRPEPKTNSGPPGAHASKQRSPGTQIGTGRLYALHSAPSLGY